MMELVEAEDLGRLSTTLLYNVNSDGWCIFCSQVMRFLFNQT